jgi:hypothetical protein
MPDLKLLKIEDGDSQKNLVDKINSNFSNIIVFGGGPYGKLGKVGQQGNPGPIGPRGSYGDPGQRGTIWSIGPTPPSNPIIGDFWIDVLSYNKIYTYNGDSWSEYGVTIAGTGIFRIFGPLKNSLGLSLQSGYFIGSNSPGDYTFVLNDATFNSSGLGTLNKSYNPQSSKLVISTNFTQGVVDSNRISERKILEFTKSEYSGLSSFNSRNPIFYWNQGATSDRGQYGLNFRSNDGFYLNLLGDLNTTSRNDSYLTYSNGLTINTSSTSLFNVNTSLFNAQLPAKKLWISSINFTNRGYLAPNVFGALPVGDDNFYASNNRLDLRTYANPTQPTLFLNTTSANDNGLAYYLGSSSNRSSKHLSINDTFNSIDLFKVFANGDVYYARRTDDIQYPTQITLSATGSYNSEMVYWIPVIPSIASDGLVSRYNGLYCSSGVDFIIDPSQANPSVNLGLSLWTPASGPNSTLSSSNKGWLSLLDSYESITFRVRIKGVTGGTQKYFRYLGLNTTSSSNGVPNGTYVSNGGNGQIVDLTSNQAYGANTVEFTIVNLSGTTARAYNTRWFKVYFSAYGGNLGSTQFLTANYSCWTASGQLFTYGATGF